MTSPGTQPASKRLVTEERANATYGRVKTINGQQPDANGNINVVPGDGGAGGIGAIFLDTDGVPYFVPNATPVVGSTYYTDFTDGTVGAAPAGWSIPWVQSAWTVESMTGAVGDKALRISPAANGRNFLAWDEVSADPERGDVEILMRWKNPTGGTGVVPQARASGALAAESGYRGGAFDGGSYTAAKYVNGTSTTLGTAAQTHGADIWYYTRFRVEGSTIQVREWEHGTAEPSTWGITVTDTSLTTPGQVGVMTTNAGTKYIDWIAVATGGRTAAQP